MWPIVFSVLAVVAVVFILMTKSSPAPPVSRETKMVALNVEPGSSYQQKTNHYEMTPVDMGPISGTESPFRVNLYKAYIE
jgi:flagellar basal body-associated protein FliL